jgi:hypothetical protein
MVALLGPLLPSCLLKGHLIIFLILTTIIYPTDVTLGGHACVSAWLDACIIVFFYGMIVFIKSWNACMLGKTINTTVLGFRVQGLGLFGVKFCVVAWFLRFRAMMIMIIRKEVRGYIKSIPPTIYRHECSGAGGPHPNALAGSSIASGKTHKPPPPPPSPASRGRAQRPPPARSLLLL